MKRKDITEKLKKLGLSERESKIYQTLLEHGFMKAGSIAHFTRMKRGIVYKILDDLIKKGFVEKHGGDTSIARYAPLSPEKLRVFVEEQERKLKEQRDIFDSIYGELKSQFNLLSGKPSVQYFEGIDGLKKLYDDINYEGEDILLLRSPLDEKYPEIIPLIEKQIEQQIERNIHTRAITPFTKTTKKMVQKYDKKRLVERCIVDPEDLQIPAQIIIYANKVGFTSFEGEIITSIIQDKGISTTMRIIFEFIWKQSQPTHKKYMEKINEK